MAFYLAEKSRIVFASEILDLSDACFYSIENGLLNRLFSLDVFDIPLGQIFDFEKALF